MQHHDDQEHQHHVHEGRDVDIGLDPTFCAANIHCHGVFSLNSRPRSLRTAAVQPGLPSRPVLHYAVFLMK
jgi:hypothetical protein